MPRDNTHDPDSGEYEPPVIKASFVPSVTSGCVPLLINFINNSSGSIETYEWDFNGDGISDSTDKNPEYIYYQTGTYDVKLKINARHGSISDEITRTIRVNFEPPERQVISDAQEGPYVIYPADIDNDGDTDVVCSYSRDNGGYNDNYLDNKLSWWENDGGEWVEHIIEEADETNALFVFSIHTADINKDGYIDIAASRYTSNSIVWWENDGTPRDDSGGDGNSWTEHIVTESISVPCSAYAIDIDGDSDIDVVGASNGLLGTSAWENSEILWWENIDQSLGQGDGDGTAWTEHSVKTGLNRASVVCSADIDCDGDNDIVAGVYGYFNETIMEYDYSEIILLENSSGDGISWTEHPVMPASGTENARGTRDLIIEDLDNDGYPDIAAAFWQDDQIAIWQNVDGTGDSWTKITVDSNFFGAQSVDAADMDNDGDIDLIGASRLDDKIAWWENTSGNCSTWEEHIVDGDFPFASSAHAVDFNLDGYMDIAGVANGYYYTNYGSSLSWWSVYNIAE